MNLERLRGLVIDDLRALAARLELAEFDLVSAITRLEQISRHGQFDALELVGALQHERVRLGAAIAATSQMLEESTSSPPGGSR